MLKVFLVSVALGMSFSLVFKSEKYVTWYLIAVSALVLVLGVAAQLVFFKNRIITTSRVILLILIPLLGAFSPIDVRFEKGSRLHVEVLPVVYVAENGRALEDLARKGLKAGRDFVVLDAPSYQNAASQSLVIRVP